MSTQLHLVEPPEPEGNGGRGARRRTQTPTRRRTARGRSVRAARGRKAHWAIDWQLDTETRMRGREGVAEARAALARAHRPEAHPLSEAS